ncbi:Glyoxylase, beta-lactamase superfamily II [Halorientalis persicus]|jgi:glyoxylase-like metal-dependent hydrolase (beta-lactamase superfamily II)|uniref:Glyoxylase, beta-lactamase superfamily II n=1 Tax=Halorientalis persicus TaxID=1367881 RepID=A0A1H8JL16_9EURY|nr:MBL fold metallo-hydrolase [Halorientalis persicus]SEN81241.1 Glyoxylase, beta-lactamase superfamily II [Halorientalis persicus]
MSSVPEITPAELYRRIEAGEPVTIVDVRQPHEYEKWRIEGQAAETVNVPDRKLSRTDPADVIEGLPTENVVTVCGTGKISRSSARHLRRGDVDAENLAGGMEAWADLSVHTELDTDADATVLQFRRPSSGCLSYLVISEDEAAVVDPLLAFVEEYVDAARERGAALTHAVDTHVHADHVSGVRALAERTGATAVVPDAATDRGIEYDQPYETIADGETLTVGDSTIEAIHTPGHTSGMTAYYVDDAVLLTGDGLFVESVARPDLEAGAEGAPEAAAQLYDSLQSRVLSLPPGTLIAPGHYSDAADPAADGSYTATLATLVDGMDALSLSSDEFVETVLADMPPRPANHTQLIATNLGRRDLPRQRALGLERGPNNCAATADAMTD